VVPDVSEERIASIFRVVEKFSKAASKQVYDPEDGGDTFLRNVGHHSTHYTASYPRRRYSSKPPL
jgi:hypothetical protein